MQWSDLADTAREKELAAALTEARAEIDDVRRTAKHLLIAANIYQDRALAAESELSTLRARVREVVGPFAALAQNYDPDEGDSHEQAWDRLYLTIGHLRAARQLMDEVK